MTKPLKIKHSSSYHRSRVSPHIVFIMDVNKRTATPPNADNHTKPSPVTPPHVIDRSTGGTDGKLQLQSTPSNRGTASVSEFFHSTRYGLHIPLYSVFIIIYSAESVGPPIFADIKHHTVDCTAEVLLKGMLSRCSLEEDKQHSAPDILDLCLKAVLPVCKKEKELRDHLTE